MTTINWRHPTDDDWNGGRDVLLVWGVASLGRWADMMIMNMADAAEIWRAKAAAGEVYVMIADRPDPPPVPGERP